MSELCCGDACYLASQWWSVMTWGDPGVCMYAFGSTGCVQSEEHRQQLLEYIEDRCKPKARNNDESDECEPCPDEYMEWFEEFYTQEEQLEMLSDYIREAPIEEVPCLR